jgi:molybdopterin converting factor small subunit
MDRLVGDYPRLKQHLYDESGTLRSFVSLFLNGEDIHLRDGLMSPVSAGDTIEILLAISGG